MTVLRINEGSIFTKLPENFQNLRNWISISVVWFPVRPRKEQETTSFSIQRRGKDSQQLAAQSMQQNKSSIWEGQDEAFAMSNANITAQGPNKEANRIILMEEYNILPLQPRNSELIRLASMWQKKLLLPATII
ncbi:hypothetical protein OUZ56_029511 [Daphnia magna]|uniref:Uncharacterized protein n=1 Tax=Daphnia magna TaxID=35525 RepID=A0ABR0B709_9CRUS|nr:hypothetical protein OUZ56_029511 [Daphnia magna]